MHIHPSTEVLSLISQSGSESPVKLYWRAGEKVLTKTDTFEHVIMACHGDEIWPILQGGEFGKRKDGHSLSGSSKSLSTGSSSISSSEDGEKVTVDLSQVSTLAVDAAESEKEFEIFKHFETTENICYLHSDLDFMPKRRNTWTSWNYLISSGAPTVSLTYNMNILQHIPSETFGDVLVTMNPERKPNQDLIQGKYTYRHPLYTLRAIRAQEQLETIQNKRGVSFCGAWTKYGFHEDGFSSGLKVAMDYLGGKVPFEIKDSTYSRGEKPGDLKIEDHALRGVLMMLLYFIRLGERVLAFPGVALLLVGLGWLIEVNLDALEWCGLLA